MACQKVFPSDARAKKKRKPNITPKRQIPHSSQVFDGRKSHLTCKSLKSVPMLQHWQTEYKN